MNVSRFITAVVTAVPMMALGAPGIAAGDTGAQVITEDSAQWDCRIHGNRVCGPGSGHPAGRYDRGALVARLSSGVCPSPITALAVGNLSPVGTQAVRFQWAADTAAR